MLDIRAGFAKSAQDRDELSFRAARITETDLSDVEAAISRYQGILAATPNHAGTLEALSTIARGDDYRVPAIEALEPILRAAQAWDQVVELLELRLAVEDAVEQRLAILGEIARIHELERRDIDSAFATWARALTEEATEAAPRQSLERLAAATGAWKRLAEVYEERMDATFDASLQRSLALRLAALYEKELADLGARRGVPAQGAGVAGRRGAGAGGAGDDPAAAGRERGAGRDPGARGRGRERAGRAGRLPHGAGRGPPGGARGRGRRADRVPRRDRPEPGAHAGARRADDAARSRGDAGGRAGRAGAARAEPRRLQRAARAVRAAPGAARRSRRARALAAQDGRGRRRSDRQPAEGAGGARARAEGRADAGRGARRSGTDRGRGQAGGGGRGQDRGRVETGDADPDAARELALRAARLYNEGSDQTSAERLYQFVLEGDAENVDALQALEGLYRTAGDEPAPGRHPGEARGGGAGSAGAAHPPAGGGAAARAARRGRHRRRHRGAAEAARGRRRRRGGAHRARAPAGGGGQRGGDGDDAGRARAHHRGSAGPRRRSGRASASCASAC